MVGAFSCGVTCKAGFRLYLRPVTGFVAWEFVASECLDLILL